ncbi:hypothetical protein [Planifilum fimeticola]
MTPPDGSMLWNSLKEIMKEAFEGPPGSGSWFTESKPDSGLFGTLKNLSAEDASRPVPTSEAPIAAHVDHIRYYIAGANSFLRGEKTELDWNLSWKIRRVDEENWQNLLRELRKEYETFMERMDQVKERDPYKTNILLGTLAHTAYHLGSLRQMVRSLP